MKRPGAREPKLKASRLASKLLKEILRFYLLKTKTFFGRCLMSKSSISNRVGWVVNTSDDELYFIPPPILTSSDDESDPTPATSSAKDCSEVKLETEQEVRSKVDDADSADSEEPRDDTSSEDNSSQSQSSSQENHESIESVPSTGLVKKIKKSRGRKKGSKSKGGNKSAKGSKKDADMDLLDHYINQNKQEGARAPSLQSEPITNSDGKPRSKELRQKLKDKREGRNSQVDKLFQKFSNQPSLQEQMRAKLRDRQAALNKTSRGKLQSLELLGKPGSFEANQARTDMLFRKYEDFIIDGRMTVEEAIELACRGTDITEPNIFVDGSAELFESEEEKRRQMEIYYRTIARMDPQNKDRMRSNIPALIQTISNEFVDHSFESPGYIEMMKTISKVERDINEGIDYEDSLTHSHWVSMCKIMYEKLGDKMHLNTQPPITDPVKFYQEALKSWIIQLMMNDLTRLSESGVFDRYDPEEKPLILACFQKHAADLFPSTEIVLDMKKVIEAEFAPKQALIYNPISPQHILLAFGLFWSFCCSYNLFIGFFRSPSGGYGYYWIDFDRLNDDVTSILEKPMKKYKETVTEMVEDDTAILNFSRELVSVGIGSSEELSRAITINTDEILDPRFIAEVSTETSALVLTPSTHDTTVDVYPDSDGRRRVKVEFGDNVSSE